MDTVKVIPFCAGSITAMEVLGIPLAKLLEADKSVELDIGEIPEPIKGKTTPTNFVISGVGVIFGVIVFVFSWAAKKALDEIYEATIRPKVKELLRAKQVNEISREGEKKLLFQLGVWYEEAAVLVLMTLVGDSFDEILEQEHLLPTIHSRAVDWLMRNGIDSQVHLYVAEAGKVNRIPMSFTNRKEAQTYLEGQWKRNT